MHNKHPNFDAEWEKHERLVWWWAKRIAQTLNKRSLYDHEHLRSCDLIGTLVLRFNKCLYGYSSAKGKFSTYFSKHIYMEVFETFLHNESERQCLHHFKQRSTAVQKVEAEVNYAYHEADYQLYRVPEVDNSELGDILDCFETREDCWRYLCRGLEPRHKFILEARFRNQDTLEAIGERLGVTKERARQLQNKALARVADRVADMRAFTCLFKVT